MNALTGIEAERVNQILRHALERLRILSYIPLQWEEDLVVDITCQPVMSALEKLWMAEEHLRELETGTSAQDGGKDISIIKQTHKTVRTACRNLLADKESLQTIMTQPQVQSDDFTKFIKYLQELKGQTLQKLTTTVEDETANRVMLHDLTEKERHYEETREILQQKLNELREEKSQVSFGLDTTLRKLENELREITRHNNEEVDTVQKEMSEATNKAKSDHEQKMKSLSELLKNLEIKVKETVDKNKEEELKMRKDKSRIEASLNEMIENYDNDMKKKSEEYDELNEKYRKESEEYAILKEHFDKIDADIAKDEEEERLLAAVKRRQDYGWWVLDTAAANIQRIARGRRDREAILKLKSKGKKGKKGKKK